MSKFSRESWIKKIEDFSSNKKLVHYKFSDEIEEMRLMHSEINELVSVSEDLSDKVRELCSHFDVPLPQESLDRAEAAIKSAREKQ